MLNWATLDPRKFERAVQMLLRKVHPDLVSIDGAGGDDGRDAERPVTTWASGDGIEAFEVKSHAGRLTSGARRQVKRSLETAVAKLPTMRKWTLVIGINASPAELTWFRTTLQAVAPEVEMAWRGVDWLDGQIGAEPALRRYLEGPTSELLRAASEYSLEREVLAGGMKDLVTRLTTLQGRVDEQSPFWTLDSATSANGPTFALRAKHPDAAALDPIVVRPRLDFSADDDAARKARTQFEATLSYGGVAELDDTHFKGLIVDASDEVKKMLGDLNQPGRFRVGSPPQRLDRPLRATLEVRDRLGGDIESTVEVSFTDYTAGARGGQIYGADPSGFIEVRLGLPRPEAGSDEGTIAGGEFNVSFGDAWDFALADVATPLRFQAAVFGGGHFGIRMSWARTSAVQQVSTEGSDEAHRLKMLSRAATVLARFEELLGVNLRLPIEFSGVEVELAEAALRALEGERVPLPGNNLQFEIEPGAATQVLGSFGEEPFPLRFEIEDHELQIGDVIVPYGLFVLELAAGRVTNREQLLNGPDDGTIQVHVAADADTPLELVGRVEVEAQRAAVLSEDGDQAT